MIDVLILEERDIQARPYGFNIVITGPDCPVEIVVQRQALNNLIDGLLKARDAYTEDEIKDYLEKMPELP